jgi:hypothetical protein
VSHDDVQLPAAQDEPGVDRRKFLIGTAAAGAGMWAAPSILSVDRAFAQTAGTDQPGGGTADCDTSAFDITVRASGRVNLSVGPFSSCSSTGGGPAVDIDTTVVTATALDTQCTQDPCRAFAQIASASIDLDTLGILLRIEATALTAEAKCSDGDTELDSSIAALRLTSGDISSDVDVETTANSTVFVTVGTVDVTVVFNQQTDDTVNAVRVTASVTNLLGETQSVDVIVASATATCTSS